MPESPGLELQKKQNANQEEIYFGQTKEELDSCAFHRERIQKAIESRNQPYREFDHLTFLQDYYSNKDAANSYLRPKRNDDEVRVVGGTTEKRLESIKNELSSMNFQSEIHAWDTLDMMVPELGTAMDTAIKRTNQIEEDEDTMDDALWEFCTQRAVFLEEVYEETEFRGRVTGTYRKRVRSSVEVLLGDMTIPAYRFQEQPYVCVYDRMSLPAARRIWGKMDNFKHVRGGQNLSNDVYGVETTFRIGFLAANEVEIIKYSSVPDDEYQVYINGVPMFKPGKELPWRYGMYNLTMGIPKRMGKHFALGRSLPSAMKYFQALDDETVRNLVRKMRQAIEPPTAVLSNNRVYSRDIWNAGNVSYGVDASVFKKLVDHDGVTPGEQAVYAIIKQAQDEFAARGNTQLGIADGPKQTATAIIQQQQNAVKMLGDLVINWSRVVRESTKLRLMNVLEHVIEPIGKQMDPATSELMDEYKRFTLRDQMLPNGKTGDKIIQFSDRDLSTEEVSALHEQEQAEGEAGKPIHVSWINAKTLKNYPYIWTVTSVSKPKENDDLHRLMFQDKLSQAQVVAQAAGRQLNGARVTDEFERTWRVHDWFQDLPPAPEAPPEGGMPASELAGAATAGIGAGTKREAMPNPTLKAAVGAVESARP